jgi:hypothetical protein
VRITPISDTSRHANILYEGRVEMLNLRELAGDLEISELR